MLAVTVVVGGAVVGAPQTLDSAFPYVAGAAAVYAMAGFALAADGRRPIPLGASLGIDILFVALLALASGGSASEVRHAFLLPAVAAMLLLRPGQSALLAGGAVLAYVAIVLLHYPGSQLRPLDRVIVEGLYLSLGAVLVVATATVLSRRAERIEGLAEERRRLVADALSAEQREQRRLSEALHDQAVQNLFAARLELRRAERGDRDTFGRAAQQIELTIDQLRETIFELSPHALQHSGDATALEQVADDYARRSKIRIELEVDPGATGSHDELLFSLCKELLSNVERHASARAASVRLARDGDWVRLLVEDDGRGIDPATRLEAVRAGHIGLASNAERVEALGGEFAVEDRSGRGTVIRASLPLAQKGDGQSRGARDLSAARRAKLREARSRSSLKHRPAKHTT